MSEEAVYEVMLRFHIRAKTKSEAWKVLQRISEGISKEFPEVIEAQPFDISEEGEK